MSTKPVGKVFKKKWGFAQKKKKPMSPALRKEVLAIVKKHESKMIELKYFDAYFSGTVSSTGVLYSLSAIATGVQIYNRQGNQVEYKDLEISLQSVVGTGDGYNVMRYIIFKWHTDDGLTAPALPYILATNLGTPYAATNPYMLDKKGNFTVLADIVHEVDETAQHTKVTRKTIPLHGKALFTTGSGTLGTDMIYILIISDSTIIPSPAFAFNTRIRFTDV